MRFNPTLEISAIEQSDTFKTGVKFTAADGSIMKIEQIDDKSVAVSFMEGERIVPLQIFTAKGLLDYLHDLTK